MKIVLGSHNRAKLAAVEAVFTDAHIICENIASNVSAQPLSDEETMQGAINRAAGAAKQIDDAYGIGLEGGVMTINDEIYLCNWGALQTPSGAVITASGARIILPSTFKQPLQCGTELSELMDAWANKRNIRHNEGAIGIFTNGEINRSAMFVHVLQLLKGQLALQEKSF